MRQIGIPNNLKRWQAPLCGALLALLLLAGAGWAQEPPGFSEGVQAYRDGLYSQAEEIFSRRRALHPEDTKNTYYLAITEAQLGRFKQAKSHYEEIIALAPNSEAAQLARQGLQYLPPENSLDPPPRFQAPDADTPAMAGVPTPTGAPSPSPQDLMMWQMMMGQFNNNGGANGMSPLPYMMMAPGMTGQPGGMGSVDPSVMSNLLMNQMMQNFSLDGGNDNR